MEIYKLSDFEGEPEKCKPSRLTKHKQYGKMDSKAPESAGVFDLENHLKITDIRPAVKHDNRVNVFVNEKYAFSLDIVQVVELKIKVGQEITAEKLTEYKNASEFGKAYQRALEWVLVRPRSVQEIKDYLRRRERTNELKSLRAEWRRANEADVDGAADNTGGQSGRRRASRSAQEKPDFSEEIVGRLAKKGYVDDRKFAEFYVENRLVKKGVSARRLEMELIKKGISREIVTEVLGGAERSDEAEIKKIIARKRAKYTDDKLVQYLCRQGFSYELAKKMVMEDEG